MLIDNVKSPEDIKGFSKEQLEKLAEEIRKGLMNRLSKKGGHFGPNFGFRGSNYCTPLCFQFACG